MYLLFIKKKIGEHESTVQMAWARIINIIWKIGQIGNGG